MATVRIGQAHKLLGLADNLSRATHFNTEECRILLRFHQKIVNCTGPLDRLNFRDVLHVVFDITDDIMLDLAFKGFDRDNDGIIDESEWAKGLSSMIRGSLEELVDFVYYIYDMNGDRSLAREELYHCLRGCMHAGYGIDIEELEECERDIVEIAMKKLDVDRDGQITFPDFQTAVITDPLLLQACGPCLAAPKSTAAFLALVTFRYRSFTGVWAVPWNNTVEETHSHKRKKSHFGHKATVHGSKDPRPSFSSTSALASLAQSKILLTAKQGTTPGEGGGGAPATSGAGGGLLTLAPPPPDDFKPTQAKVT